jgi:hypothetical protein
MTQTLYAHMNIIKKENKILVLIHRSRPAVFEAGIPIAPIVESGVWTWAQIPPSSTNCVTLVK